MVESMRTGLGKQRKRQIARQIVDSVMARAHKDSDSRGNYGAGAWPFEWTSLEGTSSREASFRLELGREELTVFVRVLISAQDDARNKVHPYESLDFRFGLGQPQTSRIHRSIGTSCFIILTTHG
jgi:hypothetical protein